MFWLLIILNKNKNILSIMTFGGWFPGSKCLKSAAGECASDVAASRNQFQRGNNFSHIGISPVMKTAIQIRERRKQGGGNRNKRRVHQITSGTSHADRSSLKFSLLHSAHQVKAQGRKCPNVLSKYETIFVLNAEF